MASNSNTPPSKLSTPQAVGSGGQTNSTGAPQAAAAAMRTSWRELWEHFAGVALSGFVIATVLAFFTWYSKAPGLVATTHDLWEHSWAIHPVFFTSVVAAVGIGIAMQGMDLSKWLDRVFTGPLLSAMAHLLSFSSGTFVPLWFVSHEDWRYRDCEGHWGAAVLFSAVVVFAILAVGGVLVIERRIQAARLKSSNPPRAQPAHSLHEEKATGLQLGLFLVMGIVCLLATFYCANLKGSTEQVVVQFLRGFQEYGCAMPASVSKTPVDAGAGH